MRPGPLEEQAARPMHEVHSPWAFASLPGLEQVLLFPVPLHPPGSHLDVTIFEKLNSEAELGAFNQTPTVPCECACTSPYHVLLSLTCLDSLQTSGASVNAAEWIDEGQSHVCNAQCPLVEGDFVLQPGFFYLCGYALNGRTQKELQCLLFQNTTGRVVLSCPSKYWAIFFFFAALSLRCSMWGFLSWWGAWPQVPSGLRDLSSPTRDWTCIPCIERWILNHWTTREVSELFYLILVFLFLFTLSFPKSLMSQH